MRNAQQPPFVYRMHAIIVDGKKTYDKWLCIDLE